MAQALETNEFSGRSHPDVKRTILFVDDVSMFRELGKVFLSRTGVVMTAADGREALDLAETRRPDLVLTDLHMPGMDGEELIRALRSIPEFARVPIVAMLSHQDGDDYARVTRAGADDILTKPLSRLSLLESANRHLRFRARNARPRIPLKMPVELRMASDAATGTALNLSRGGLFVESSSRIALHTEIDVRFTLPETDCAVDSTTQVVWTKRSIEGSEPNGLGMRFLGLSDQEIHALDDYIHERAEDSRFEGPGPALEAGAAS